jgi:transposase
MAKRQFILTHVQAAELHQGYLRTKDGPTRTRYQAVRLYGSGYPVPQIQQITGGSRTSLMDWCRLYRTDGLQGLVDGRVGGNRAKLTPVQRHMVSAKLLQYTPQQVFGSEAATADGQFWTVSDLKRAVQWWCGVTWDSHSSYLALFADCNFTYQRTQKVFKSRREADVVAFEEQLEKT